MAKRPLAPLLAGVAVGGGLVAALTWTAPLGAWGILASLAITGGLSAGLLAWGGALGAGLPDATAAVAVLLGLAIHLRRRGWWTWHSGILALGASACAGWPGAALGATVALATPLLMPRGGPGRGTLTLVNTVLGQGTFGLCCTLLPLLLPILAWLPAGAVAGLLRFGSWLTLRSPPTMCWRWRCAPDLPPGPWVVVANHSSVLDILACLAIPGRPRRCLAKAWVFRTPGLGWAARIGGMLPTERLEDGRIVDGLPADADLVVFPEGTRRASLGRFRAGALQAADDLGRPLVAMVHHGAGHCLAPGGPWIRPGLMTSCVLTVPPLEGDRAARSRALKAWFATALASPPPTPAWISLAMRLEDRAHRGPWQRWNLWSPR